MLEFMQKVDASHHKKVLLIIYPISPNLVCTSLPVQFFPLLEINEMFPQTVPEKNVDGPNFVFTRKTVDDEVLIRKLSNNCKSFLELKLANFRLILCVSPHIYFFLQFPKLITICKDSSTNKTRQRHLKIWSCLVFNELETSVKHRASILNELKWGLVLRSLQHRF